MMIEELITFSVENNQSAGDTGSSENSDDTKQDDEKDPFPFMISALPCVC